MSEELYFNNELRKCLNAAGLSDCGENDAWNYWYQRVHKAHDQTIDRMTEVQRVENAKLRELMSVMAYCIQGWRECDGCRVNGGAGIITERAGCYVLLDRLRELGVEVES